MMVRGLISNLILDVVLSPVGSTWFVLKQKYVIYLISVGSLLYWNI